MNDRPTDLREYECPSCSSRFRVPDGSTKPETCRRCREEERAEPQPGNSAAESGKPDPNQPAPLVRPAKMPAEIPQANTDCPMEEVSDGYYWFGCAAGFLLSLAGVFIDAERTREEHSPPKVKYRTIVVSPDSRSTIAPEDVPPGYEGVLRIEDLLYPTDQQPPAPVRRTDFGRLTADEGAVLLWLQLGAFEQYRMAAAEDDPHGMQLLRRTSRVLDLSAGTAIRIRERAEERFHVVVLEGPWQGTSGWLATESVRPLEPDEPIPEPNRGQAE